MAGLPSVRGNEREDVDGAGVSRVGGVEVGTERQGRTRMPVLVSVTSSASWCLPFNG